jgi:hypothetical protein
LKRAARSRRITTGLLPGDGGQSRGLGGRVTGAAVVAPAWVAVGAEVCGWSFAPEQDPVGPVLLLVRDVAELVVDHVAISGSARSAPAFVTSRFSPGLRVRAPRWPSRAVRAALSGASFLRTGLAGRRRAHAYSADHERGLGDDAELVGRHLGGADGPAEADAARHRQAAQDRAAAMATRLKVIERTGSGNLSGR